MACYWGHRPVNISGRGRRLPNERGNKVMRCKRCRTPMRESPAVHHKKRKWVCPKCGRARMQRTGKSKGGRKERSGGWED